MPDWTNNFNDSQSDDTIQAGLSAALTYNATTARLSSFAKYDSDGNGSENWKVNDTFFFPNSATTLHTIESIVRTSSDSEGVITFTPGVKAAVGLGVLITKEDSYKGNHGSAAEHLRKRNQGSI